VQAHTREIAAGPAEAGDPTDLHRIEAAQKNDRYRVGGRFRRPGRNDTSAGGDQGNSLADQLRSHVGQSIVMALGPTIFDGQVLALDITALAQALTESTDKSFEGSR